MHNCTKLRLKGSLYIWIVCLGGVYDQYTVPARLGSFYIILQIQPAGNQVRYHQIGYEI